MSNDYGDQGTEYQKTVRGTVFQTSLKTPAKQPKTGRLCLNDSSCLRLRAEYRNHVWSYDFVHCRTDDGKVFRALNVLNEHSRECLAIKVQRKPNSTDIIDAQTDLFILREPPAFIRSDSGPEFVAKTLRDWITAVGAKTACVESGSPWGNGYCESFNGQMRDELLNGEVFYSLLEAQILIDEWKKHDRTKSPHSPLGFRPPAPETIIPMDQRPTTDQQSNWTSRMRLTRIFSQPSKVAILNPRFDLLPA